MTEYKWFPATDIANSVHEALAECIEAGYIPPPSWDSIEQRIINPTSGKFWELHHTLGLVGSLILDGEQCKFVANIPLDPNTDPDYIERMIKKGLLVDGACPLSDSDKNIIVNTNDRRDKANNLICSIKPLTEWRKKSYVLTFEEALTHPMCEPACGTLDRARRYYKTLEENKFVNLILNESYIRETTSLLFWDDKGHFVRPLTLGNLYEPHIASYKEFTFLARCVGWRS